MGEELIQRCKECESCPIESMLEPEQRKRSVLDKPFPERHIHREIIEQICGRNYDFPCEMKYASMRLSCHDRIAVQNAVIAMSLLYFSKVYRREIDFHEGSEIWTAEQDLERGIIESYASRFETVWNLGLSDRRQSISVLNIQGTVIANPRTYEIGIEFYTALSKERWVRES